MRVNISEIIKNHGAYLDIKFSEDLPDLDVIADEYIVKNPIDFKGRVVNFSGILKLEGCLKTNYTAKCFRCLKEMDESIEIDITEDFVEAGKGDTDEAYTFEGNYIDLDKPLKDNIILSLPTRKLCKEDCKGICPQCGCNLNEESCNCEDDKINPQMEVLKNFFK